MADYDWFSPTQEQLHEQHLYAEELENKGFEEVGYPSTTLVCLYCGSVVYGRLHDRWAGIHRNACGTPVDGKHRKS